MNILRKTYKEHFESTNVNAKKPGRAAGGGGGGGGDLKQKGMKMGGKGSFVWKLGISNFRIKA